MKKIITVLLSVLFVSQKTNAQNYLPVPTTGYGFDAIAENTTAVLTTDGTLDGVNVMYSQAYAALVNSSYGLPNNGMLSSATQTFQLQNYTGPNMLFVQPLGQDTITFITPAACWSVSLLGFATDAFSPTTMSVTIVFTDNTTQSFSGVTVYDWLYTVQTPFATGIDRLNRSSDTPENQGHAGFFTNDLALSCVNQIKLIKQIIVTNTGTSSEKLCMLAVSALTPTYGATSSTLAICAGGSVSLSGSGLSTYTWEPVGSFAGSNSANIVVSPTTTTSYTLDGDIAGNSCPGRTIVTINSALGNPTISLAGSSPSVCLGAAATITASGAFTYTLSNGVANGGTFTPNATANYTVVAENGCGTSTAVISISVSPLQITVSTSTNLVCSGDIATLSASGATSYLWIPGPSTSSNYIASPIANTIYTVTGQTGNCIGTNTIAVNTLPLPSLTITPSSNTPICSGESINLTVTGNAVTYTWSPGGQNSTTISDMPSQVSIYNVSGTGSNGCMGEASQIILVHPNPVVNVVSSSSILCPGGSATVTASGANSYSWNTSDVTSSILINPTSDMTYTVTGTSTITGCSSTTFVTVSVLQPSLNITSDVPAVCVGFQANITASGADTYTWSNGSNLQSISASPVQTSVFTVTGTVTDPNSGLGCDASATIQIGVNPSPTITATANHTIICQGESAILTGSGAGAAGTYTWTGGSSAVFNSTTAVSPIATQNYTVTGVDVNGCKGKTSIIVTVKICTGISSVSADQTDLIIYPNPNNGEFTIKADGNLNLILINQLGEVVRQVDLLQANGHQISMSDLSAGIYFLTGKTDTYSFSRKIIVTK